MGIPNVSDDVYRAWSRFAHSANWSVLHPLDEDRYYQFLWAAYQEGHLIGDTFIESFLPKNLSETMRDSLIRRAETAHGLLDVVTGKGSRG